MNKALNKTDAGKGSKAICRVSNVLPSQSLDPGRSANFATSLATLKPAWAFSLP